MTQRRWMRAKRRYKRALRDIFANLRFFVPVGRANYANPPVGPTAKVSFPSESGTIPRGAFEALGRTVARQVADDLRIPGKYLSAPAHAKN